MRRTSGWISGLAVLATVALTGCQGIADPDGHDLTLRVGDRVVDEMTGLTIEFLGVTEDSRCPSDATCVWEGNAALRFRITGGEVDTTFTVNTTVEPRLVRTRDGSLAIVDLAPVPVLDQVIEPDAYTVTVRVAPS